MSTMLRRRLLAVVAVAFLLAFGGACSSSADSTGPPSGASDGTGSDGTPVATVPATVPARVPVPPATPIKIPVATDGTSADGSGCAPGSATALPDGVWFGILTAVDTEAGTVGLDLACWFTGAAANAAAAADGQTEIPVPDDYYIRNQVHTIYTTRAVPKVAVVPLDVTQGGPTGASGQTQTGIGAALAILESSPSKLVWVQVTDGWVTVVQSQFTP